MEETVNTVKRPRIKYWLTRISMFCLSVLTFTTTCFASGQESSAAGTTSSAITDVGSALTGVIGYMAQTTAAILGDDLWILGMGFFVLSFIAGFVMYLFQVGRR